MSAALLLALALAAQAPPSTVPPGGGDAAAEPPVVAIELRSDAPLTDREQLRSLLAVTMGGSLTEEAVRRTLTNLYATGAAWEIEILSRPAEGGVVAVVALWTSVAVEEVRIEGAAGLRREELAQGLPQAAGQPLLEDRVIRGVYRLQDLYRERGYLEASVRVRVDYLDPRERRAVVVYQVASGPQAVVGTVAFEGDVAPFSAQQLVSRLRLAPGDPFRLRAAEESAERLQRWLIDEDHLLARVDEPRQEYDPESDRMGLTYPIEVGPKVVVRVSGADLADLRKRDLLPFLGPEGYDEALLLQAVERIERHFQERGFYRVRVESGEERRNGQLLVSLAIDRGAQYTLEEVVFTGNERVADAQLAELMTTTPRRLLTLGSGRLVDEVLTEDLENLRAYYALQGFAEAQVSPPRVEEAGDALRVVIEIAEGRRRRVAGLAFSGVEALDAGELRRTLADQGLLEAGGPFHPVLLEDTMEVVRARYEEEGFPSAQVSAETEWNDDATRVEVVIRVLEGPRTTVDRIIVRGNRKTGGPVVRRALDLRSGEPVSRARLLEAQRRLYGLGAFSRVDVDLAPAAPGAETRDVVVQVEEGKTRRLTYGVGYDTEDGVRGLVGFSNTNLWGRGFTFGTDLRLALDVVESFDDPPLRDGRARVSLTQPFIGRWDLPLTYTLFYVDEEREGFNVVRRGGRVEATRRFGGERRHRAGLAYDYRLVNSETLAMPGEGGEPDRPDREDSDIRISSLIPSVLFDGRDDPLDPTRGWTSYAQVQYAFPFLDSSEEFLKGFVQQTAYLPLGGRFGVVAASLRAGAIEPFRAAGDDPVLPPELPSSRVSIAERFFAGGANSHRAYRRDELGIPDETLLRDGGDLVPVGGNGLLLFNLDWRFPVLGAVGGVLFFDAGNVWADWRDVDPADAKLGVGAGVRYLSPIGPLRLEVGYKLDPEEDERPFAVFLSVGNPF